MKLHDAILIGKTCGLDTIAECVLNIEMHSISLFTYHNIKKELGELYKERKMYQSGELELDWDEIDKATNEAFEEMKEDEEIVLCEL